MGSTDGGLAVGPSHENGGIDFVVQGRPVEIEGGEIAVCTNAFYSAKQHEYKGTPKQILMDIQSDYGCNTKKITKLSPGEWIICKRVVDLKKTLTVKGTVREIVNYLQSLGGCVVDMNGCPDGSCDHVVEKKEEGGWLHGSKFNFCNTGFSLKRLNEGQGQNIYGKGIYLTDDEVLAKYYAKYVVSKDENEMLERKVATDFGFSNYDEIPYDFEKKGYKSKYGKHHKYDYFDHVLKKYIDSQKKEGYVYEATLFKGKKKNQYKIIDFTATPKDRWMDAQNDLSNLTNTLNKNKKKYFALMEKCIEEFNLKFNKKEYSEKYQDAIKHLQSAIDNFYSYNSHYNPGYNNALYNVTYDVKKIFEPDYWGFSFATNYHRDKYNDDQRSDMRKKSDIMAAHNIATFFQDAGYDALIYSFEFDITPMKNDTEHYAKAIVVFNPENVSIEKCKAGKVEKTPEKDNRSAKKKIDEFIDLIKQYNEGGPISNNPAAWEMPDKRIYEYALKIKKEYPEIWAKGGNIFGNEAFRLLQRTIKTGYWKPGWINFYKKWQSFKARHQHNKNLPGVIANLKWLSYGNLGAEGAKEVINDAIGRLKTIKEEGGPTNNNEITQIGNDIYISRDVSALPKDTIIVEHRYDNKIKAGELGFFTGEVGKVDIGFGKDVAYVSIGKNANVITIDSSEDYLNKNLRGKELEEFNLYILNKYSSASQTNYPYKDYKDFFENADILDNPSTAWYELEKKTIEMLERVNGKFDVLEMRWEDELVPHQYLILNVPDPNLKFEDGGIIQHEQLLPNNNGFNYVIGNKTVGYIKYEYSLNGSFSIGLENFNNELYIEMVWTHPNYRHRGIAKKLISAVIQKAMQMKIELITLRRDVGMGCQAGTDYDNYLKSLYSYLGFVDTWTEQESKASGGEKNICGMHLNIQDYFSKTPNATVWHMHDGEVLKPLVPVAELAKKHNVSEDYIQSEMEDGAKVEMEHTGDTDTAKIIASHHIEEDKDYYKKLDTLGLRNGGVVNSDKYPFYSYAMINQFISMVEGKEILSKNEYCFLQQVYQSIITGTKFNRPQLEKIAAGCNLDKFRSIKELTELAYLLLYRSIAMNNSLNVDQKYERIIDIYNRQTTLSFGDQQTIILQQYSTPSPISFLLGQWCLDQKSKVNFPAVLTAKKQSSSSSGYKAFKGTSSKMDEYVVEFADGYEYSTLRAIDRDHAIDLAKAHYYDILNKQGSTTNLWVLEPSAGNGMLTVALNPEKVVVNELDTLRNKSLQIQGYAKIYNESASQPLDFISGNNFDIVLSNPPFGGSDPVKFGEYELSALEHIMIAYALEKMADNGRAAFIIGGHTKYDAKGRIVGRDRQFLQFLSKSYQLLDVINVDGGLYARQGTTFPIRVILISGRKSSDKNFPLYSDMPDLFDRLSPKKISNFMDLKQRIYGR